MQSLTFPNFKYLFPDLKTLIKNHSCCFITKPHYGVDHFESFLFPTKLNYVLSTTLRLPMLFASLKSSFTTNS